MTSTPSPQGVPRTLIPITINFAVRYVVLTGLLKQLEAHSEPVLGLSWDDPALEADLRATGAEVVRLPTPWVDRETSITLTQIDSEFHRRLRSPTPGIEHQRRTLEQSVPERVRRWASRTRWEFESRLPGARARLAERLEQGYERSESLAEHEAFLRDLRIDTIVSITPYAVQESLLLPAAARLGLPLATSVLSFDNLTARPPLPATFERYLVWNAFNAEQLVRGYPELDPDRIGIVGPAQFDFYQDPRYVEPLPAWQERLDVAPGAPTIFFGAGPPVVAPHEPQFLAHLLEGIADGRLDPETIVVLRRHPHDFPERWAPFRDHPSVRYDDPGPIGTQVRPGQAAMGEAQIVGLCSTLAHTDVHVSVSSTLTLDGAFFGKPQIGPAYDVEGSRRHRWQAVALYRREHFVPIVASGGLELPGSPSELVAQVRGAFDDPGRLEPQRRAMLTSVCTYLDGACTDRVAAELNAFLDGVPVGPAAPGQVLPEAP